MREILEAQLIMESQHSELGVDRQSRCGTASFALAQPISYPQSLFVSSVKGMRGRPLLHSKFAIPASGDTSQCLCPQLTDRMHCEDLIPTTQASSIPMALPHEGVVLRRTFTNILPGVLVLDFYEKYYIDDTEDDIYEARDELRDEMLRWAQHNFRLKQFSILISGDEN